MAICPNCTKVYEDTLKECPYCGNELTAEIKEASISNQILLLAEVLIYLSLVAYVFWLIDFLKEILGDQYPKTNPVLLVLLALPGLVILIAQAITFHRVRKLSQG